MSSKGIAFECNWLKFLTSSFLVSTGWRVTVTYSITLEHICRYVANFYSDVHDEWEKSSPDDYALSFLTFVKQ